MGDPTDKKAGGVSLLQLLPNMMTIGAICAGLSAIRSGVQGSFEIAVILVLVAGVLDGLDGRIARLLGSDSRLGAELDSLADFLNFGVAAPLILYLWGLQDIPRLGWVAVLAFSVCCVLRLARFNVGNKSEVIGPKGAFFEGVPAPAGALLAMLPLYVAFAFDGALMMPSWAVALYMIVVGWMMVSKLPTWSFKMTRIPRGKVRLFLVGVACAGAAFFTYAWLALIGLCLGYIVVVIWALLGHQNTKDP